MSTATAAPGGTAQVPKTLPGWLRGLEVVVGLIALSLAFVALIDPGLGLLLLAFFFAFALLFLGVSKIAQGAAGPKEEGGSSRKGLDVGLGIGAIILSFIVFILPGLGVLTLLIFLYVGLVLIGITWMAASAASSQAPGWFRALGIILGVLALAFAIVAIVYPAIGLAVLVIFFAVALILMGIGDLLTGITGKPWVMIRMPSSMDQMAPGQGLPPAQPPAK